MATAGKRAPQVDFFLIGFARSVKVRNIVVVFAWFTGYRRLSLLGGPYRSTVFRIFFL